MFANLITFSNFSIVVGDEKDKLIKCVEVVFIQDLHLHFDWFYIDQSLLFLSANAILRISKSVLSAYFVWIVKL